MKSTNLNLNEDDGDEREHGADALHDGHGELDERELVVEPGHPEPVVDAGERAPGGRAGSRPARRQARPRPRRGRACRTRPTAGTDPGARRRGAPPRTRTRRR
jgi:hypothetical protein